MKRLTATVWFKGNEKTLTFEDVILCRPNNGMLEVSYNTDDGAMGHLFPFDRIYEVQVSEVNSDT